MMKLLVGLGNHPREYENTRHNLGFRAVDFVAKKWKASSWKKDFSGVFCETFYKSEKVLLLKPHTYMNNSGLSVKALMQYYGIALKDLLIYSDDLDLPFGTIRFRKNGSHGGQRGLKSIFEALETSEIARIKLGISNEDRAKNSAEDFVLSRLSSSEEESLPAILEQALLKAETLFLNSPL